VRLVAQYKPNTTLIEQHASGRPLIDQLRHKGIQGVKEWRPSTDKRTRMFGETTKLESLYLPKSAPWKEAFMREYLTFPGGHGICGSPAHRGQGSCGALGHLEGKTPMSDDSPASIYETQLVPAIFECWVRAALDDRMRLNNGDFP
jgi:hypothetical protein